MKKFISVTGSEVSAFNYDPAVDAKVETSAKMFMVAFPREFSEEMLNAAELELEAWYKARIKSHDATIASDDITVEDDKKSVFRVRAAKAGKMSKNDAVAIIEAWSKWRAAKTLGATAAQQPQAQQSSDDQTKSQPKDNSDKDETKSKSKDDSAKDKPKDDSAKDKPKDESAKDDPDEDNSDEDKTDEDSSEDEDKEEKFEFPFKHITEEEFEQEIKKGDALMNEFRRRCAASAK